MFKRCRHWHRLLSRRADNTLSSKDWGTLQDHLASCSCCRQLIEADDALHDVLGDYTPQFSLNSARSFDDKIVASLLTGSIPTSPLSLSAKYWRKVRVYWRTLPLDLFGQIGGGAAFALGLTIFSLIPALHFNPGAHNARHSDSLAVGTIEKAALPVSIESLLNVPSPRAAMLWTAPNERRSRVTGSSLPVQDTTVLPDYSVSPYSKLPHPNSSDLTGSYPAMHGTKPAAPKAKPVKKATFKHSALITNEAVG